MSTLLDLADEWAAEYVEVLREATRHWLELGTWMTVLQLGRSALRRDEEPDVFDALRSMPAPLVRVDPPGSLVVLRIRGLVVAPAARPLLEAYVRSLRLARHRLMADDDEEPVLRSEDLVPTLHVPPQAVRHVSELILNEDWMFDGGFGSASEGWERNIDERLRPVMGVKSVEDYLQIEGQRLWSQPVHRTPTRLPVAVDRRASGAALESRDIHPRLAEASVQLVEDGHFNEAVHAGTIAFRDVLRGASGLAHLDGHDLAGAALGGPTPSIVLADLATQDGRNEQDGWRMLAQGCFAALRNPVAHRRVYEDRLSAMEALAAMSLVARKLESQRGPTEQATQLESSKPATGVEAAPLKGRR